MEECRGAERLRSDRGGSENPGVRAAFCGRRGFVRVSAAVAYRPYSGYARAGAVTRGEI